MTKTNVRLAIVVPCYNEEEVLAETTFRLTMVMDEMVSEKEVSPDSIILYVNDGSCDRTWEIIQEYNKTNRYVCGINLARNVGHQNALMAGLMTAKNITDVVISIDADLQDDTSVIREMLRGYRADCDIVYGVRKERKTDSAFKRNTALAFYKLMAAMGVRSVYNHADYRLMSKRALEHLSHFRETNLFLRGIVPLIGYKSANVYYDRAERFAGESKYPFRKMMNFAIDGITSFSIKPIRMVFGLGVSFMVVSLFVLIYVIYSLICNNAVSGWASLMLSIWFVGGCCLLGIGIIGEYVGKIYTEVKDRPRYNIEDVLLK